jgi:hypothetical protein
MAEKTQFKESVLANTIGLLVIRSSSFHILDGTAMLWPIVLSVAIVEALLFVLPIELAGTITLLRLWLFGD